jgi:hypothetical protein
MPYERSCDYDTGDQHLKSFVTLIIAPRLAWNSVLTLLMPPPLRFGRRPHDRQYAPCYTYSHKNLEGKAQTLQTLRSDPVITRYHSLGLLPDVYLYTSKVEGLLRFNTCISAYKWDQEFRIRESPRAVITLIMQEPGTDDQLIIIKAEDDRDLPARLDVEFLTNKKRGFSDLPRHAVVQIMQELIGPPKTVTKVLPDVAKSLHASGRDSLYGTLKLSSKSTTLDAPCYLPSLPISLWASRRFVDFASRTHYLQTEFIVEFIFTEVGLHKDGYQHVDQPWRHPH